MFIRGLAYGYYPFASKRNSSLFSSISICNKPFDDAFRFFETPNLPLSRVFGYNEVFQGYRNQIGLFKIGFCSVSDVRRGKDSDLIRNKFSDDTFVRRKINRISEIPDLSSSRVFSNNDVFWGFRNPIGLSKIGFCSVGSVHRGVDSDSICNKPFDDTFVREKINGIWKIPNLCSSRVFGYNVVFRGYRNQIGLSKMGFCSVSNVRRDIDTDSMERVCEIVMDNSRHYDMETVLDELGLEPTTDLVVGVLRKIHFEEKIAFRFFMWAGRQENYDHEVAAYNEMMDILSSTKYKVKQFRIVCDMLDYMKRSGKKYVPIEVLLKFLREYTLKYMTHVQKFAQKKRFRVKTLPEINAFNLLLDCLCKCCLAEDAEALFMRMKKSLKPDVNTYNVLFFGWCRVRNPTRGMKILEEMIELGHTPDHFTYNTAIDSFCKAGMMDEAAELFEFMRTKGSTISSPTAKTYATMIVALVRNNRMEECFKLLGHMINSGCLPNVSTYKELIEEMCLSGKIDDAYRLLEEMGKNGYPPDIVTYNCFLDVLCENKNSSEALRLYERMIEVDCKPSVQTYNMLISMFFKMGDPDGAFETWQEMDKRGCAQDIDTYCVMIDGLFNCNKVDDACSLIEDVMDKGMKLPYRSFDSFLMQLSVIGNLRAIHKLSDHMRKFYNPSMARRFALNQKRKSIGFRNK